MASSRWADEIEEEEGYTPTIEVAKATAKKPQLGIARENEKVVIDSKTDPDTGKKFKVFRTFRLEKQLVSKGVVARKNWPKFGQSSRDKPGPNSYTTVVADDVQMQFLSSDKNGDVNMDDLDPLAKAKLDGKGIVKCRFCQDNHFSAKCPYKDVGLPPLDTISSKIGEEALLDGKKDSEARPGVFLPPALRGGNRRGETMMSQSSRKDDATIRVSNLPESMSETDMQELCAPFGKIERIFLAKDRTTGICKGFAFITYQSREVAQRALRALNGYGYDHLILNVEWSQKRTE